MEATNKTPGLRVRRTALKSNGYIPGSRTKYRTKAKEECHSALLPVFVIAAVWSLGCWLLIWIRLYSSFTEDSTGGPLTSLGKRRDNILAIRLKQLLDGNVLTETTNFSSRTGSIDMQKFDLVLKQMYDSNITKRVQDLLMADSQHPQLVLGAYLEPPLELDANEHMKLRTHGPDALTHVSYPYNQNPNATRNTVGACEQNGAQWTLPTFHPPNMDNYFEGNAFRKKPMFDKRWELALGIESDIKRPQSNSAVRGGYCPVDADPFLPWIHDVIPSKDGTHVEFVISNKRRCNTDPSVFQSDLKNLEPQIALASNVCTNR